MSRSSLTEGWWKTPSAVRGGKSPVLLGLRGTFYPKRSFSADPFLTFDSVYETAI